jgi:hypothetical protein
LSLSCYFLSVCNHVQLYEDAFSGMVDDAQAVAGPVHEARGKCDWTRREA